MTITIDRHPTLTCPACSLSCGEDRTFVTDRAVFFRLLWHRDAGDVVSRDLLDDFDPNGPVETIPPREKVVPGSPGMRDSVGLSGSYGEGHDRNVQPEHFGKARGRRAVRRGRVRY